MNINELAPAERRFRVWMYISAWMYAVSGLFFFVAGSRIAPLVNEISGRYLSMLSPYPLPSGGPEGAFWLVLSLSMMAMITWISRAVYIDIRRNGNLVPILLLSKFCSTAFYVWYFVAGRQLVHLVGAFTDGPLFLITLWLWLPASTRDKHMTETEEDILLAIGEVLMPQGGAFKAGFNDFRDECVADARRLMGVQNSIANSSIRFMFRVVDMLPVFSTFPPVTLRRMPPAKREIFLRKLEHSRFSVIRMIFFATKLNTLLPFFNRPEIERVVGYTLPEDEK